MNLSMGRVRPIFALALLFLGLTVLSCGDSSEQSAEQPPLQAAFKFTKEGRAVSFEVTQPLEIDQRYTFLWDFDDGSSSHAVNPLHFYAEPGTYRVSLLLQNSLGQEVKTDQVVTVEEPLPCKATWQSLRSPKGIKWRAFAHGTPGSVAVGSNGEIYFSKNGFEWCEIPSPFGRSFSVEWNENESVFYGLARRTYFVLDEFVDYTLLIRSFDGIQWEKRNIVGVEPSKIAFNGTKGIFLRKDRPVDSALVIDHFTGQREVTLTTNGWFSRVFWNGEFFVIYGRKSRDGSAANYSWVSKDGSDWEEMEISQEVLTSTAVSNGDVFLQHQNGLNLEISSNGIEFVPLEVTLPEESYHLTSGGGKFLALGDTLAMVSSDGRVWQSTPHGIDFRVSPVTPTWMGTHWLVWTDNPNGQLMWSQDGFEWTPLPLEEHQRDQFNWYAAAVEGDGFIIGGSHGSLLSSSDGDSWKESRVAPDFEIRGMAQTSYGLMVCGNGKEDDKVRGQVYRRENQTWLETSGLDESRSMEDIATYAGRVAAVSDFGELFLSVDGAHFQRVRHFSSTSKLTATDDGFYLINHALWRSEDGFHWERMDIPFKTNAMAKRNGQWVVTGEKDLFGITPATMLAISTDLENWEIVDLPFATYIQHIAVDASGYYAYGTPYVREWGVQRDADHVAFLFSKDGFTWRPDDPPTSSLVREVIAWSGGILAVGEKDLVLKRSAQQGAEGFPE